MHGYFLTSQPFVRIFFDEPGALLFGLLLILMSATTVLVFLVKKIPSIADFLIGGLLLIDLILFGILAFDFVGTVNHVYTMMETRMLSELYSTHRWILMQVPILFTTIAAILAMVCRGHMNESHAKEYVFIMQFCTVVSFLTVLLIGYESLI